jgi:hypothetical protein
VSQTPITLTGRTEKTIRAPAEVVGLVVYYPDIRKNLSECSNSLEFAVVSPRACSLLKTNLHIWPLVPAIDGGARPAATELLMKIWLDRKELVLWAWIIPYCISRIRCFKLSSDMVGKGVYRQEVARRIECGSRNKSRGYSVVVDDRSCVREGLRKQHWSV